MIKYINNNNNKNNIWTDDIMIKYLLIFTYEF